MARILVVEDDLGQLEIRQQILENAGYEVVTAQSADEGLERLPGCHLVLTDLRIPNPKDGRRLIQAVAGQASIIVLSGAPPDESLPVEEFLSKPCPSKRLLEAIAKWTSESR